MNHYEIIFMVHPDQSDRVPSMIERYQNLVASHGGRVHRMEDWGRLTLAYPIQKHVKAHYVLMNIECEHHTLQEIETGFRFNDALLRHLTLRRREAISMPSVMMQKKESEEAIEHSPDQPSSASQAAPAMADNSSANDENAENIEMENEQSSPEDDPLEGDIQTE